MNGSSCCVLVMVVGCLQGGSVAHIMRYRYPEGLDEVVIATIMKEVLTALAYVHSHGGIHRWDAGLSSRPTMTVGWLPPTDARPQPGEPRVAARAASNKVKLDVAGQRNSRCS
jgi:hypothetical protein